MGLAPGRVAQPEQSSFTQYCPCQALPHPLSSPEGSVSQQIYYLKCFLLREKQAKTPALILLLFTVPASYGIEFHQKRWDNWLNSGSKSNPQETRVAMNIARFFLLCSKAGWTQAWSPTQSPGSHSCPHLWFYPCVQSVTSFPGGASGKEPACQSRRLKRQGFDPWVGKIPWRRAWQPTPIFLPGESHGQRSLGGYSPWGCTESDTTEAT